MREWCPDNVEIGLGKLRDHRWMVTTRGYSNLIDALGEVVYGWVYQISPADEQSLDEKEGPFYRPRMFAVEVNEKTVQALVYIDAAVKDEGRPKPEYVESMKRGLNDRTLPAEYVSVIVGIISQGH